MENRATKVSDEMDSNRQSQDAASASRSKKSDTAFRTISEVANELDVQQHVLRFWETKFSYVRPLKRGGGRRYYRPEDLTLLKAIHKLLYTDGYTIKGVQKLLREQGKNQVIDSVFSDEDVKEPGRAGAGDVKNLDDVRKKNTLNAQQTSDLKDALAELREVRKMVSSA